LKKSLSSDAGSEKASSSKAEKAKPVAKRAKPKAGAKRKSA
jgi:hypothetical protein